MVNLIKKCKVFIKDVLSESEKRKNCFSGLDGLLAPGVYEPATDNRFWRKRGTQTPACYRRLVFPPIEGLSFNGRIYNRFASGCAHRIKKSKVAPPLFFQGSFLFYRADNKTSLLIDDERELVLRKYPDNTLIERRALLSSTFPLPPLVHIDKERHLFIEKLIADVPVSAEERIRGLLHHLARIYSDSRNIEWIPFPKEQKDVLFAVLKESGNTGLVGPLESLLSSSLHPKVILQGDLWAPNVLFDGQSFFFIDYEDVSIGFAYTDLFFFSVGPDEETKRDFYNGNYDLLLAEAFSAMDLRYRPEWKPLYQLLSLFLHLKIRGISINPEHVQNLLNRHWTSTVSEFC